MTKNDFDAKYNVYYSLGSDEIENLVPGTILIFWHKDLDQDYIFKFKEYDPYIRTVSGNYGNFLISVDVGRNLIYLYKDIVKSLDCSCGAKHTSQPKWHYDWCIESKFKRK